ncbi:MAG: hypothetical protein COA96_16970 [SAR86 cluster bacterium]|uniref:Uncharacterized protein n=1 Tax=SAR86 cluster bacterium TaxID=2030880 RepID=A0A2A5AGU6_9GAMM|nr:MAG: hypothetical protein COA96_16970 [SAR86 cluster bacterium]
MPKTVHIVTSGANDGWASDPAGCSPFFDTDDEFIPINGSEDSADAYIFSGFTMDGSAIEGNVLSITLEIYYRALTGIALPTVQAQLNSVTHNLRVKFYGSDSIETLENPFSLWVENSGQTYQFLNSWTVQEEIVQTFPFSAYRMRHELNVSLLDDAAFGPNNELTVLLIKDVNQFNDLSTPVWAYDKSASLAVNVTTITSSRFNRKRSMASRLIPMIEANK